MNATNSSASDNRKASGYKHYESDFLQSVRDKSVYARLITPPGLKALVIAIALALLSGLVVFMNAGNIPTDAAADLATSFALIILFSFVIGTWLSVNFEMVLIKLMAHAFDILESRINRLIERVSEFRGEHVEADNPQDDSTIDYRAAVIKLLYFISFPFMGACLIFWILQKYTYMDSLAVSQVQSTINIYTAFLYVSLTAGALLVCWIGGRIVWVWYRIRTLEKKIDTATLKPSIHTLVPVNTSIAVYLSRLHRQTARFVTGVF